MLRGGSWNNNRRNARVSYRNHNDAANVNNNVGFRVVVAPDLRPIGKAAAPRCPAG
jgi:formylglycine-generating enzyme required for sulfatase activity